ncbi:MAG: glycosyltransferase family 39 protein [Acidimicrobiales bacterium]|nr:glycosyltransferase family 39 protein [Acidimicrobiales bacterium]
MAETPAPRSRQLVDVVVLAVVAIGVVLRFVVSSSLWMDEALSVNIARLPLGEIPGALRKDGHPPGYYILLHGWMRLFGEGDTAVRALSGLFAVALIPLVFVAARRVAGRRAAVCSVVLLAWSPFAVRFATEARMYAMVSTLAMGGWILAESAWRRPRTAVLGGLALCTAGLLWTHYWAMWLVAVAGAFVTAALIRARRDGARGTMNSAAKVLAALGLGCVMFLPWVGSLIYQAAHTGTPWARPARPAEMLSFLASDLGGGRAAEGEVAGWGIIALALVGAWLVAPRSGAVSIDVRTPRDRRLVVMAVVAFGTLVVGNVAGYLTDTAFSSRYASVVFPLVIVLAGTSISSFRPKWSGASVLVVCLVLYGPGLADNMVKDRTDGRRNAEAIMARAEPGDLVVYCPDQTGPATARELSGDLEQVTFPDFSSPERVDWVDYIERNEAARPQEFARDVLARARGRSVFLVYSVAIHSHRETCPALLEELAKSRQAQVLESASDAWEPSGVVYLPPNR